MVVDGTRNDQMGRLGEIEFDRLAIQAGLLPTSVLPDRTGKDRVLEFPQDNSILAGTPSFDRRAPPKQIIVQIKSTNIKKNRISISLSVAERLSKDLRPAVIVVLSFIDSNILSHMYFIHILHDNLSRILKSLREAYANNIILNKANISFRLDKFDKIPASSGALYERMVQLSGDDTYQYALTKKTQIENLGFDSDFKYCLIGEMDSHSVIEEEEMHLGIRDISVTQPILFERRFGIDIPIANMDNLSLGLIDLADKDDGILEVRNIKNGYCQDIECAIKTANVTYPSIIKFDIGPLTVTVRKDNSTISFSMNQDKEFSFIQWEKALITANCLIEDKNNIRVIGKCVYTEFKTTKMRGVRRKTIHIFMDACEKLRILANLPVIYINMSGFEVGNLHQIELALAIIVLKIGVTLPVCIPSILGEIIIGKQAIYVFYFFFYGHWVAASSNGRLVYKKSSNGSHYFELHVNGLLEIEKLNGDIRSAFNIFCNRIITACDNSYLVASSELIDHEELKICFNDTREKTQFT